MPDNKNSGFTLVELIMVIALIAIVSTLAISKYGNLKSTAARKVSVANQQAVGRAFETFLALNDGKLNRLDALVDAGSSSSSEGFDFGDQGALGAVGGLYRGPDDIGSLTRETVDARNAGLHPGLVEVLCSYTLDASEAAALRDLGLKYVMQHNTYAEGYPSQHYTNDDGSIPQAADGLDPELSACVARAVTNGLVCAAVNGRTDFGRVIYQDCGQDLLPTARWGQSYDESTVKSEIAATGGPLLAFGLGSSSSIVGASNGGIDAAPYSEVVNTKYYRQYIVLFRIRSSGSGSATVKTAEFAGVIDPEGNSIRKARHMLKSGSI